MREKKDTEPHSHCMEGHAKRCDSELQNCSRQANWHFHSQRVIHDWSNTILLMAVPPNKKLNNKQTNGWFARQNIAERRNCDRHRNMVSWAEHLIHSVETQLNTAASRRIVHPSTNCYSFGTRHIQSSFDRRHRRSCSSVSCARLLFILFFSSCEIEK